MKLWPLLGGFVGVLAASLASAGEDDPQAVGGLGLQYLRTTVRVKEGDGPTVESGNAYAPEIFIYGLGRRFFMRAEASILGAMWKRSTGKNFVAPGGGEAYYRYSNSQLATLFFKLSGGVFFPVGDMFSIGPGFYLAESQLEKVDAATNNYYPQGVAQHRYVTTVAPQLRAALFAPWQSDLKLAVTVAGAYGFGFGNSNSGVTRGSSANVEFGLLTAYKALFLFTSYEIDVHDVPAERSEWDRRLHIQAGLFKVGIGAVVSYL